MRPLKYKNLGEMSIIRVPQITATILPQLQDLMQQLEESGEDSREDMSIEQKDLAIALARGILEAYGVG